MRIPLLEAATEQLSQFSQWHTRDVEEVIGHVAAATVNIVTPTIAKRQSSSTCAPDNNSAVCQKPTDSNGSIQTVAIALGAGIPLGCAVVVLFFLHRRHVKRQRLEDLNDPHKSLDFGLETKASKGKGGPEMSIKDMGSGRRLKGLSMNMDSPYLLPGELHGSRASLRSMSRSVHDENDPYRPVTLVKGDWESMRAPRGPNGSVYSAAGSMQSGAENASLIANARPMSQSFPKRGESTSPIDATADTSLQKSTGRKPVPNRKDVDKAPPSMMTPKSDLDDFVPPPPPPPPKEDSVRPPRTSSASAGSVVRPTRSSSISKHAVPAIVEPFPQELQSPPTFETDDILASYDSETPTDHAPAPVHDNRMSMMGVRPLPSDLPDDNPEQRANRIRSFYKEYFDDSRPNPKGGYVDDYDAGYLADYAIYDAAMGPSKPYAQPMGRRAMTPPPRGAGAPRGMSPAFNGPHRRHMSTQSGAPGGRGRAASAPRKRLPPPATLTSLPTPHMLKDDSGIFNAIDFAPPTSFRDRQNGRAPDSPSGGVARPYSPSVMPHTPLMGSYDDLAAIPSPHLLRKSGTFTALDFAPPPRFKDQGNASDAGSIRSNRSGISAVQQEAIRAGAYRVSRIPTEMVTTKEDFSNQLKPRWDMRAGSNIMG